MEIGLFPLGLVLLPDGAVPLHIFEPRYRELSAESSETSRPFGPRVRDDDGSAGPGTLVDSRSRSSDGLRGRAG
jgi:Lon protease-like protein